MEIVLRPQICDVTSPYIQRGRQRQNDRQLQAAGEKKQSVNATFVYLFNATELNSERGVNCSQTLRTTYRRRDQSRSI